MKRLGLILPETICDIIICLPIAKWYADRDYEVIWPIDASIINNFIDYIDYVKFFPIENNCHEARSICRTMNCDKIIDLSLFTILHSSPFNIEIYERQNVFSYDEFMYQLAGVPFEEKWNLQIKRNLEREDELYNQLVKQDAYYVTITKTDEGEYQLGGLNIPLQRIEVKPLTASVFDWIKILSNATAQIVVDGAFISLIEQLKLPVKVERHILLRPHKYTAVLYDGEFKDIARTKFDWLVAKQAPSN